MLTCFSGLGGIRCCKNSRQKCTVSALCVKSPQGVSVKIEGAKVTQKKIIEGMVLNGKMKIFFNAPSERQLAFLYTQVLSPFLLVDFGIRPIHGGHFAVTHSQAVQALFGEQFP